MKPWTSSPMSKDDARKLARWWDGLRGASGRVWSAEVHACHRGYVVRVH